MRKNVMFLSLLGLLAATPALAADRSGDAVFNAVCKTCHATGLLNAPKLGDKAAWAPRIAQGIDVLHQHAKAGIRSMPPKGTCTTCTDKEIENAVDYMVTQAGGNPKAKKK